MEQFGDDSFAGAERQEDGDYVYPNGVVVPDPDNYAYCEGIMPSGFRHMMQTQGRVLEYHRSDPTMPARVRVLCNFCREAEEQRDQERQAARARRKAAAEAASPAITAEPPSRSAADILAELAELLGEAGPAAA